MDGTDRTVQAQRRERAAAEAVTVTATLPGRVAEQLHDAAPEFGGISGVIKQALVIFFRLDRYVLVPADAELQQALEREAAARGLPVDVLATELLRRGLGKSAPE